MSFREGSQIPSLKKWYALEQGGFKDEEPEFIRAIQEHSNGYVHLSRMGHELLRATREHDLHRRSRQITEKVQWV